MSFIDYSFAAGGPAGPPGASGESFTFTAVKTSAYTAQNGEIVRCNTSGGAFTVTVPTSPSADWRFGVILTTEAAAQANALTVSAGAGPHDNKLYCQGDYIIYQYDGTTWQTVRCYLKPHRGRMRRAAAQTVATGTNVVVALDTTDFQAGGVAATEKFTIRRAGVYAVTAMSSIGGLDDTQGLVVGINVNTVRVLQNIQYANATNQGADLTNHALLNLAAGDNVELAMLHQAGENQSTNTATQLQPHLSIMEVR